MFSIYVSLTKGQRPSFKKFHSGGNKTVIISNKFLEDQLKCLRLYHCFHEANNRKMCIIIEHADIFINDKKIVFEFTALMASDIESISLFLTSSFKKKWKSLELWVCIIQDRGLNVLYHGLCHGNAITIDKLILTDNSVTMQSFSLISEIIVNCKVKDLLIGGNNSIGEDQQLYSTLTNPSVLLEQLSNGGYPVINYSRNRSLHCIRIQ